MIDSESVLCFPSPCLGDRSFQGYSNDLSLLHILFGVGRPGIFLSRGQLEFDFNFKQVIVYSVVQYGVKKEDILYYSYVRGKSGGEDRLKSFRSIGIGGHVSESVKQYRSPFAYSKGSIELEWCKKEAKREIEEELNINTDNPLVYICGLINDDSNDVGKVHFGLVYRFITFDINISPKCDSIIDGGWVTSKDLLLNKDLYESWSKILIEEFVK